MLSLSEVKVFFLPPSKLHSQAGSYTVIIAQRREEESEKTPSQEEGYDRREGMAVGTLSGSRRLWRREKNKSKEKARLEMFAV